MSTNASNPPTPSGLLNVAKPSGVTSRAVVDRVARLFRKVKVGHAGTLDPLASGVLVIALGPATRLIEYVQRQPKTYRTVVRLGARSDTDDADGAIRPVADPPIPTLEEVARVVATQVGTFAQKPPAYSALKLAGKRAYDLARAGQAVELAARPVTIHRIEVLSHAWPHLELEIDCEGGTYVRSIARDIGEALGCGGLVDVLVREAIGRFQLAHAIDPDRLETQADVSRFLQPAATAVSALASVVLTWEQIADIGQGRVARIEPNSATAGAGEVALFDPEGRLVAVGEVDATRGRVSPRRVLVGVS